MFVWRSVVAVAAVVVASSVHAAAAPARATLAGTTVVTGGRTAAMAVRLPRPVALDVYADVAVRSPRGRMTALVLKKEGAWNTPMAQAVHYGFCASPACETAFPTDSLNHVWAPGSTDGLKGTLPAGDYRLYLVTDGAPATFTLRLRGLAGSTRLTPRDAARAAVVAPKPTMAEPASSPALFAGGGARTVPARGGINATVVWKDLPVYGTPSATGLCVYDGDPPTGAAAAFQAPCSSGRGGMPPYFSGTHAAGPATTPVGPGRFVSRITSSYLLPPGRWAIGGYHDTPGPVTAAYVHQLWLDF